MLAWLEWLLLFIFLLFAEPSYQSLQIGAIVSFLGILLRVSASGYRFDGKAPILFGPYRFVRQPHLLGSFLGVVGLALAGRQGLAAFVLLPILAMAYWKAAKEEQVRFKHKWGLDYVRWVEPIPMFIPSLFPVHRPKAPSQPFSLRQSLVKNPNKEIYTFLLAGIVYGVFYGSMNTNFRLLYSSSIVVLGIFAIVGRFLWVRQNEVSSQ